MQSCNLTKHVPDGEYLLDRVHLTGDLGAVSEDDLSDYVRQQPNDRFIHLWRVGLGVYSASRVDSASRTGFGNWLQRIGSEPVIYDSAMQTHTAEQLRLVLMRKGYYDASVDDTLELTGDKRCEVTYRIKAGEVYRISHVGFSVPEGEVGDIILADTANTLLHPGDPLDIETHDAEQGRIARRLQEGTTHSQETTYISKLTVRSGAIGWRTA